MKNISSAIDELVEAWQKAGVENGDTLLLHSKTTYLLAKYRSKGIYLTPQHILDSLMICIGSEGTLLLPLFNFDFPKKKFFDINSSQSQMGAITELARKSPNVVRTGHPIYSFAVLGKNSSLFSRVDNISGYGDDSPFGILHRLQGKIASLDLDDQKSMTFYHYIEEMNQVEYRYFKNFTGTYIDSTGCQKIKTYKLFVRDIDKSVITHVNPAGELLWKNGFYKGNRPTQGFGLRTIKSTDMYNFVSELIKQGKALNNLYKIQD